MDFISKHPALADRPLEHYLASGRHSAENLRALIKTHCSVGTPSMLEFASGYGCMTRHMPEYLPGVRITACDIHEAAVAFVHETFGVPTILSTTEPERLKIGASFDIVTAISFFSHVPHSTWGRWLNALADQTAAGGLLIFTTHGLKSPRLADAVIGENGFYFTALSEQADLDAAQYGTAFTTFDYVYRKIQDINGVQLIRYQQALWWGHQDAYVLRKSSPGRA